MIELTKYQLIALTEAIDFIKKNPTANEYLAEVIGRRGIEELMTAEKVLTTALNGRTV